MAGGILQPPRKLEKHDDRSFFDSGAVELDEWLQKYAWQNLTANNAITYVTTLNDTVVGFYAICASGISQAHAPKEFRKHRPRDIPCVLLARLAVDRRMQGKRIGRQLLRDAIARAITASESIGAACLLIHARDETARDFYLRNVDLLESPVDPLHLILPTKTARRLSAR